jgi:multiple sugar transport system ATP-binding protein
MNFVHGKIGINNGEKRFFSNGGLVLPLPNTSAEEGRQVTYGIRPEHISIGDSDDSVTMQVVVIEPTGSETQIFARSGEELIDALVKDRFSAKLRSELSGRFNIDDKSVFRWFPSRRAAGSAFRVVTTSWC